MPTLSQIAKGKEAAELGFCKSGALRSYLSFLVSIRRASSYCKAISGSVGDAIPAFRHLTRTPNDTILTSMG
jgi:hypothetical protein